MPTDELAKIELFNTLPKVFDSEEVVSEVWNQNVEFEKGKYYIIEAASGTGKSSLCSYIYGNRTDYLGNIHFDGVDIRQFKINVWQRMRRSIIAYLPQELSLFPELTALQNVELKNSLTGYASSQQISQWFEELGIYNRKDYPVGKMSIGQQQRVAIIRALCQPFSFLLLDEPVSHLDEANNLIVSEIILREAKRQGAAVIATSVGNNLRINVDKIYKL